MAKPKWRVFPEQYGYFPYIFLIYLFLPAYYIVQESGWLMMAGWGMLLLFLISYRQTYITADTGYFTFWIIVQLGIILFLTLIFSINNIFLSFFTAYFLGWYKQTKLFLQVYLIFFIINLLPIILHYESLIGTESYYYFIYIVIMFAAPFGVKSMHSRIELQKKLNDANKKIEKLVKQEERMRIARDLHDTLGHTLSLITLKSQLVSKLIEKDTERAKNEAEEIERTSRAALTQVRELVSDMREISFIDELAQSKEILESAGIAYYIDGEMYVEDIPSVQQNIMSLCLKEAITNMVKHSEAENCYITLKPTSRTIQLIIRDDGLGFNKNNGSGNGIQGMLERLELVDGDLNIKTEEGTTVTINLPLVAKNRKVGVSW